MIDDGYPVREAFRLVHVVRGEDHGCSRRTQPVDQVPGGVARLRVQAGRGLVEEHQLRAADDGGGEGQPLLLAPGQALERRPGVPGQSEPVKQVGRVEGVGVEARHHPQVLTGPHGRRDPPGLEHHPHPGPQPAGVGHWVQAKHRHRARVRAAVALAYLHRAGLARPVRAQHRRYGAPPGGQREAVHRRDPSVPFDEVVDLDGGGGVHAGECRCSAAPISGDRQPGRLGPGAPARRPPPRPARTPAAGPGPPPDATAPPA